MLEEFMKNSSLWEGLILKKMMGETPHWSKEEWKEEEAAKKTCDEFATTSCTLRFSDGRGGEAGSEVESGKKTEVERSHFNISLYFSLSDSDLIGNILISPSQLCFAHGSNWWINSPCPCLDIWAFCYIFCLLSSWGVGMTEWLGG